MSDPADSDVDPVRRAIGHQGAVLARHEETMQNLSRTLAEVLAALGSLQPPQGPPAPPAESPPVAAPYHREPHVTAPERFTGEPGRCRPFLLQCSLVFEQQPSSYPTDRARIAYVIGALSGRALSWATAVWTTGGSLSSSYGSFTGELLKVFDHPEGGPDPGKRLTSLRQGLRSVADYTIEFRTLSAESGWNDAALRAVFHQGLTETMKDELASRDEPTDLEQLISLSIRLDNRLRERRRERVPRSQPRPLSPLRRPQSPPPRTPASPGTHLNSEPEPMQLGRARLTPEERARRRAEGACLYCGQPGHLVATCPTRPGNERARQ